MNKFLFVVTAIGTLLSGCIAWPAWAESGLIIMHVRGAELNNMGSRLGALPLSSYSLMNIETRKVLRWNSTTRVLVVEADAGIYCLYSVAYLNLNSQYCGDPYFRVVAGRVNNVVEWHYGFNFAENAVKLLSSASRLVETLDAAAGYDGPLLKKYGYEEPAVKSSER